MDNRIAICADRNPFAGVDELVGVIAEVGFDAVEWFEVADEAPWSAPATARRLRALVRRHELISQYHAPYEAPYDLAREGDELRTPDSIARMLSEVFDRAERLGARMTTLHLGTCPPASDRAEALRMVTEGIRLAAPELAKRRMRLGLENHTAVFLDNALGDRPGEFDRLMENLQSEWIGRTLDIGHAHVNGHLEEFLARPFDRVFNVHLHDNDGAEDQHLPFGAGSVPWDDVLRRIAKECYKGPLTLEFFADAEVYHRAFSRIRRCN